MKIKVKNSDLKEVINWLKNGGESKSVVLQYTESGEGLFRLETKNAVYSAPIQLSEVETDTSDKKLKNREGFYAIFDSIQFKKLNSFLDTSSKDADVTISSIVAENGLRRFKFSLKRGVVWINEIEHTYIERNIPVVLGTVDVKDLFDTALLFSKIALSNSASANQSSLGAVVFEANEDFSGITLGATNRYVVGRHCANFEKIDSPDNEKELEALRKGVLIPKEVLFKVGESGKVDVVGVFIRDHLSVGLSLPDGKAVLFTPLGNEERIVSTLFNTIASKYDEIEEDSGVKVNRKELSRAIKTVSSLSSSNKITLKFNEESLVVTDGENSLEIPTTSDQEDREPISFMEEVIIKMLDTVDSDEVRLVLQSSSGRERASTMAVVPGDLPRVDGGEESRLESIRTVVFGVSK